MAKSVAKYLSPLILSFIILFGAVCFIKANYGDVLWALSMFMSNGEMPATPKRQILFEEKKEDPAAETEDPDVVDGNDIVYPKRGALYARLAIPSCGIEDNVYFSDDKETLRLGLGQYYGSHLPGYGQPILISGHNNRSFHTLGDAKVGDVVTITTNYGVYEYRITGTEIRKADTFSWEELNRQEEILILYTCYPFTTMSLTSQRYFVYAEKISGPVVLH